MTIYLESIGIIVFGFLGGVYFAFSFFVMRSLNELSCSNAVRTMIVINKVILKSPFMFLFISSTIIALLLVISSLILNEPFSNNSFSGVIFLIGMFLCTAIKNVPLNKKLEELTDIDSVYESEVEWSNYYHNWTKWNHVRTASCLLSTALLISK